MPKTLVHHELAGSRQAHDNEDWDPDWIAFAFTAWLKCTDPKCGEDVVVSGTGGMEAEYDGEDGGFDFQERYYPRYVWPMPDVIDMPAKCPENVATELRGAFGLMFQDADAAAAKVRIALERLMDHVGVQTRRRDDKGTFFSLSLHQRIELFAEKQAALASELMAVKWLGNTGSHEGQTSRDDLLDAFEILEHALAEVVEKRSEKAATLAKRLTKKHAPKRRAT